MREFHKFESLIFDADMNKIDVARHPDNIYYLYLDANKLNLNH